MEKNCTQIGLKIKSYHFEYWSHLAHSDPFYLEPIRAMQNHRQEYLLEI
jgi:hypothetical protein